jgi:hypothetical protein
MTAKGRTANAPIPTLANARGTADANSGINRTLASW